MRGEAALYGAGGTSTFLERDVMEDEVVYVVVGQARSEQATNGTEPVAISVMLMADDADHAVEQAVDALEDDGFDDVEIEQVGAIDHAPDNDLKEPYDAARAGDIAIIE
ncbi:MAG: hypothetical protein EB075_15605, partial [Bacteroidetes bacterium]|nr:hypothetical protein [Bacteroidota bacterium]